MLKSKRKYTEQNQNQSSSYLNDDSTVCMNAKDTECNMADQEEYQSGKNLKSGNKERKNKSDSELSYLSHGSLIFGASKLMAQENNNIAANNILINCHPRKKTDEAPRAPINSHSKN